MRAVLKGGDGLPRPLASELGQAFEVCSLLTTSGHRMADTL